MSIGLRAANAGQSFSDGGPASIDDYVKTNPDFPNAYQVPWLGIEVKNGQCKFKDRYRLDGVEVLFVLPGGPAAAAGLQGERQQVQAALTVGLLAASLFFPPAMLGVAVLGASGIGKSQDLIIAVDGERTHDLSDFGEALNQAAPGEAVYFTVISNGQRKQLQVALPRARP